ncbi:unnamed protein product [Closterium sp. Yama58-4]|nr:unnamed protein product [Closterium sp. Yama58-4]
MVDPRASSQASSNDSTRQGLPGYRTPGLRPRALPSVRGVWQQWMLHECLYSTLRLVIDASALKPVLLLPPERAAAAAAVEEGVGDWEGEEKGEGREEGVGEGEGGGEGAGKEEGEEELNAYLALSYGSFPLSLSSTSGHSQNEHGSATKQQQQQQQHYVSGEPRVSLSDVPWALVPCAHPGAAGFCFQPRDKQQRGMVPAEGGSEDEDGGGGEEQRCIGRVQREELMQAAAAWRRQGVGLRRRREAKRKEVELGGEDEEEVGALAFERVEHDEVMLRVLRQVVRRGAGMRRSGGREKGREKDMQEDEGLDGEEAAAGRRGSSGWHGSARGTNSEAEVREGTVGTEGAGRTVRVEGAGTAEGDEARTVVLAVVASNYREVMMSWVCGLRRLHVHNYVIAAMDRETYDFAREQGLPVFPHAYDDAFGRDECHFGTDCFLNVTKVKSRAALRVLRAGYHVLFNDADIYWFADARPIVMGYGPGHMVVQSDNHNDTGPDNDYRRLNSGFYFIRSEPRALAALEAVVAHAAASPITEQPSFYDVLCGASSEYTVGDSRCLNPKFNLTVDFLDRSRFPNGATRMLFHMGNSVRKGCEEMGCIIIHNNWVAGRRKKIRRQVKQGLWDYDVGARMCIRSWYGSMLQQLY